MKINQEYLEGCMLIKGMTLQNFASLLWYKTASGKKKKYEVGHTRLVIRGKRPIRPPFVLALTRVANEFGWDMEKILVEE